MNLKDSLIRIVDLPEIFKIKNVPKKKKGKIAISILTPTDTIHAMPTSNELDSHRDLAKPIYDIIAPSIANPSSYHIEIRYAIYSSTSKTAYLIIPLYITESQYGELNFIMTALRMNGFTLTSLHTDFDPRKMVERFTKYKEELDGSDILSYMKEYGFVLDYDLPFKNYKIPTEEQETKII